MKRVKDNLKSLFSVVVPALVFIFIIAFASAFALSMEKRGVGGMWAVAACIGAVIFINAYVFYVFKVRKEKINPVLKIILVFSNAVFLSSLAPLFVQGADKDAAGVKAVVTNVYIFYGIAIGLIILGFLLTIYWMRESIQKSNWWVFIASLPYIFVGWMIQKDFISFHHFVNMEDFTNQNVANMIKDVHSDMSLLNPSWYKFLSILIICLVFMLGMIAVETTWKKTSGWRKKGKTAEAAKNKKKI